MIKVTESRYLDASGFTFVELDSPLPLKGWSKVFIDGQEVRIMPITGFVDTSFGVKGKYDFTGRTVQFV